MRPEERLLVDFPTDRHHADELEREFHALAQPLMSLQCCLEIGCLVTEEQALRKTVEEGLREFQKVLSAVQHLREVTKKSIVASGAAPCIAPRAK